MKTFAKKAIAFYSKLASGKLLRRGILTATTAFLIVFCMGELADFLRELTAYHTMGTFLVVLGGINVMLSRQKISRIWRKLSAMGEEAQPVQAASAPQTASAVAAEFAAAVNDGGEEVFED